MLKKDFNNLIPSYRLPLEIGCKFEGEELFSRYFSVRNN